jgi:hypothetical protein
LKNAFLAFFNLAKCRAKLRTARKITTWVVILDRIRPITQPVEFFNRLLGAGDVSADSPAFTVAFAGIMRTIYK